MLTSLKNLLQKAYSEKFAIPAFNAANLEVMESIIMAAAVEKSPVILQFTENDGKYAGWKTLTKLVTQLAAQVDIPVVLHLDHCKTLDLLKHAVELGFTSVMFDASMLDFEDNIALTAKAVLIAHEKNITVEAELGAIEGSQEDLFTNPEQAGEFVKKTGIDSLAVSIGTTHGLSKGQINLDFELLEQLKKTTEIPLVLHGASSIPQEIVAKINEFGGELQNASGLPIDQLQQAIQYGICKANSRTDLNLVFTASIREFFNKRPQEYDMRKVLGYVKENIVAYVRKRIQVLGSGGKI